MLEGCLENTPNGSSAAKYLLPRESKRFGPNPGTAVGLSVSSSSSQGRWGMGDQHT